MAVYTKKWNGSSWVTAPVKRWNGSSWVDAKVMKWNGSSWVQIYPETAISKSQTITATASGMSNYRTTWSNWGNTGEARQGNGSQYGGSSAYYGFLNMNRTSWTGTGSISAVSSASFSGTRGGSGYYNNDQTIKFYRSATNVNTSGGPVGLEGNWTCSTGAPGSGKAMSNRTISSTGNLLNWMNGVGSKNYAYIYSNVSGDYLNVTSASITANYTYLAKSLVYTSKDAMPIQMTRDMYKMETGKEPYFTVLAYKDEENMTLEEIITRREQGVVENISFDSVIQGYDPKPWSKEYEITFNKETQTCSARVEVFNMGMEDEVQCSLDKEEWTTMINTDGNNNYHEAELPKDFNRYSDFVYVRVINKKKEEIVIEMTIEPKIFIPDQTKGIISINNIDIENLLK